VVIEGLKKHKTADCVYINSHIHTDLNLDAGLKFILKQVVHCLVIAD